MPRFDCIVVGTGPAGLEAALNLKIRNKNFLLLGPAELSRKVEVAHEVNNYLGLPRITGTQMADAFAGHLRIMDIAVTPEKVSMIYPMGDFFSVATAHNLYEATTVILAPGVFTSASFPGEDRLLGRGVSYCATCDAPLYKGKTVAIIGYNDEAVSEANFMAEIASKVYYIPAGKKQASPVPQVEIIPESEIFPEKDMEIIGEERVTALKLKDRELVVDGVFILRDSIAPSSLLQGLELDGRHIAVDSAMATNIPGCFAAGDCTGRPYQYIRSAGQGLVAAHSAVEYIDKNKG